LAISSKRSDDGDDKDIIISIDTLLALRLQTEVLSGCNKRNGILRRRKVIKIHIAIDIKTKEILDLEVTNEKSHDGKIMPKLIDYI
jgi:hypothetical protein